MKALDRFLEHGTSDVPCDRCGDPIVFVRISYEAETSSCTCGRYNARFRG